MDFMAVERSHGMIVLSSHVRVQRGRNRFTLQISTSKILMTLHCSFFTRFDFIFGYSQASEIASATRNINFFNAESKQVFFTKICN